MKKLAVALAAAILLVLVQPLTPDAASYAPLGRWITVAVMFAVAAALGALMLRREV